jgi:antitoxin (DNA-binding transcriptional repressor) of toxin-antitoxin stability system
MKVRRYSENKLTQLLTAVDKGERVTIERHGHTIAEIVKPSARRIPRFGTLKGVVQMSPEQVREATRSMTAEEIEGFLEGR